MKTSLDVVLMYARSRSSFPSSQTVSQAEGELMELRRQAAPVESLTFVCPDHGRQEFDCFLHEALVLACGCQWRDEGERGPVLVRTHVGGGDE